MTYYVAGLIINTMSLQKIICSRVLELVSAETNPDIKKTNTNINK
jgi:hypothetical protein